MKARPQHWLALLAALGLAGCGADIQSVLVPRGSEAGQIATLAWLLFGLGVVVLAIVMAATWLAIRGSPRMRAALSRERSILALGLAFPAVMLTLLLGTNAWLMRARLAFGATDAVQIAVTGEQWWWRVDLWRRRRRSRAPTRSAFRSAVRCEFTLQAADVIHSFWVPSLGGKVDMIPGRTTQLASHRRATRHLSRPMRRILRRPACADGVRGHRHAGGRVRRVAARARRCRRTSRASEPERRGQSLFVAAGCGACHAVRGTAANGTIGPDLTHLGGRRSVGIDTLPLTAENLARFIADGQHIKPGNRMPEFRIFAADELAALAAYLLSLR